jgi:hypothetical protein
MQLATPSACGTTRGYKRFQTTQSCHGARVLKGKSAEREKWIACIIANGQPIIDCRDGFAQFAVIMYS